MGRPYLHGVDLRRSRAGRRCRPAVHAPLLRYAHHGTRHLPDSVVGPEDSRLGRHRRLRVRRRSRPGGPGRGGDGMSAELEAYFTALTQVRRRIHETAIAGHVAALAELRLDEERASVTALTDAEGALCLAARDLARAVDHLPLERQPKGWNA